MRIPKIGSGRDGVRWAEWKRHMPVTLGLHLCVEISSSAMTGTCAGTCHLQKKVERWSGVVASTPATSSSSLSHLSLTSLAACRSGQAPKDPTTKNCHLAEDVGADSELGTVDGSPDSLLPSTPTLWVQHSLSFSFYDHHESIAPGRRAF